MRVLLELGVTIQMGKHHLADCQPADTLTAAAVDGSGNVPNNGVTSQTTAVAALAYVTL